MREPPEGSPPPTGAGSGFDRLLAHRSRLMISVLLARYDRLSFSRLKELTGETDGNLGANLRKLEDEGYVACTKEFVARRPLSWYALTDRGREALRAHVASLEALIAAARGPHPT